MHDQSEFQCDQSSAGNPVYVRVFSSDSLQFSSQSDFLIRTCEFALMIISIHVT